MLFDKKLFLYACVSGAVGFSSSALAQSGTEEVVVVGIRGALEQALDLKRDSTSVIDAVNAEDIGKFPDNNVAEALGRIPGIAVSRQFGQGDAISIRGASNALTLTTLNGQSISSSGWYSQQAINRTFDYSMLPPELIASITVQKSSQADLVEGGVGGTVNIKTRKPLDLQAHSVFASIKSVVDSTATDENDPSASILYSFKNDAETFGFLIAGAQSDYTLERRGNEALPAWGGRIAPTHFEQTRERTAYDITLQMAPNDALDMTLHYLNLEQVADGVNTAIWIPQDLANCSAENEQHVPTRCSSSDAWLALTDGSSDSFWDVRPRMATMESEVTDFSLMYQGDSFSVSATAGKTEATGGTNLETNFGYLDGVGGAAGTVDATGDVVDFQLTNPVFTLPTAGNYASWQGLQAGQIVNQPRSDEETYFQMDFEFDIEMGIFNSIKTGFRTTSHETVQSQNRPLLDSYDADAAAASLDGADFTNGTLEAGMDHFIVPAPNAEAMLAYTLDQVGPVSSWQSVRSGYSTVEEDNFAVYVMTGFEVDQFRGNLGFRYISTEAATDYYAPDPGVTGQALNQNNGYSTSLTTDKATYNDVLPSVNLIFDLNDDTLLRFTAAKVISRPNYFDMFGSSALVGYSDTIQGNEAVRKGNIALKPYSAFQSDIAWEWYYDEGDMLSVTYFVKDVNSFTTFVNIPDQQIGIVDPDTGEDSWLLQSLTNGNGGQIRGFEIQVQNAFDNGFGVVFNLTSAHTSADPANFPDRNTVFSDSSDLSYNLVGYYENDRFSARAAYNWRSEYFIRETGFYGAREHQDYGTLDLTFGFNVTENFKLIAEVNNATEEDSVQVGRDLTAVPTFWRTSYGYPAYTYEGERRITAGAELRF